MRSSKERECKRVEEYSINNEKQCNKSQKEIERKRKTHRENCNILQSEGERESKCRQKTKEEF